MVVRNFLCRSPNPGHSKRALELPFYGMKKVGYNDLFKQHSCEVTEGGRLCFLSEGDLRSYFQKWGSGRTTSGHFHICGYCGRSSLLSNSILPPPLPPTKLQRLVFAFRAERKEGKAHSKYLVSFESMCYSKHLQGLGFLK